MPAHLSPETLRQYLQRSIPSSHLIEVDDHLSVCKECRAHLLSIRRYASEPSSIEISPGVWRAPNTAEFSGIGNELVEASKESGSSVPSSAMACTTSEMSTTDNRPVDALKFVSQFSKSLRDNLHGSGEPRTAHLSFEILEAYVDNKLTTGEKRLVQSHLLECQSCMEELKDLHRFAQEVSAHGRHQAFQSAANIIREGLTTDNSLSTPRRVDWVDRWNTFLSWLTFRRASLIGLLAATIIIAYSLNSVHSIAPQNHPSQSAGNPSEGIKLGAHGEGSGLVSRDTSDPFEDLKLGAHGEGGSESLSASRELGAMGRAAVRFAFLSSTDKAIVGDAIVADRLEIPAELAELSGMQVSITRGFEETSDPKPLSPVGTFVSTANPTFRWKGASNASAYVVKIYDYSLNLVDSSPTVSDTKWRSTARLHANTPYLWRVIPSDQNEESAVSRTELPEASFQIIEPSQRKSIQELVRAHPEEHFALGVLLAHAGLLDDAAAEFAAVPQTDPYYSTARKLLEQLEQLRASNIQIIPIPKHHH